MPARLIAALLSLCVLASCTSGGGAVRRFTAEDDHLEPPREYRIGIGDELDVRLFYTPDLNQAVTVRPDGKVALALVGDLPAVGMTPAQLAVSVEAAYRPRIKRPQAVVNVRGFAMQRVFVGGEVHKPGVMVLSGPMTALQAIMAAEGMKETADVERVVVVRRAAGGERQVFSISVDEVVKGRDVVQDVALQPFDMVFVPRSDVADVNHWIDMYIKRNLPFGVGASYAGGIQ